MGSIDELISFLEGGKTRDDAIKKGYTPQQYASARSKISRLAKGTTPGSKGNPMDKKEAVSEGNPNDVSFVSPSVGDMGNPQSNKKDTKRKRTRVAQNKKTAAEQKAGTEGDIVNVGGSGLWKKIVLAVGGLLILLALIYKLGKKNQPEQPHPRESQTLKTRRSLRKI